MGMATLRKLYSSVASKDKINLAKSPSLERKPYHDVGISKASNPRTDPNTKIGTKISNPRTASYETTSRKDFEARRDIQDIGRNQLANPRIDPYTKIGTKQILNPRTDSNTNIGTQVSNPKTASYEMTGRRDFENRMDIGRNQLSNPRLDPYTKMGTERLSNPMKDPLPPNTKISTKELDPRTNPNTNIGIQVSNNNTYPKLKEMVSKAIYGCKEFVENNTGVRSTLYKRTIGNVTRSDYIEKGGDIFRTNIGVDGEISYIINSPSIFGLKSTVEVGKGGVEFSLSAQDKIGSSVGNGIKISPQNFKVFGTTSATTPTGYTNELRLEKDIIDERKLKAGVTIVAAGLTIAYSVGNDVSGVGVLDNALILSAAEKIMKAIPILGH